MKKQWKTGWLALSSALMAIGLLAGCSASGSEQKAAENAGAEEKKALVVGLDDTFAPMGFRDDNGELVGFDIDLAREAAKRLKLTLDFQPIDWSMKENELIAGNIDLIWNGYSMTEERKKKVALTEPYLKNRQILVVKKDSPIQKQEDLADKSVGVQAESSALDSLKAEKGLTESLEGGAPVEFATINEAIRDLETGRCDAVVADEAFTRYYLKNKENGGDFKVLDVGFVQEQMAVGLRKGDPLKEKLDGTLAEIKKDGTYEKLYNKWFEK